jgi:putative ABC transport system permease protein
MQMLIRKALRDLWNLRWQMGAIVLVLACGVGVLVMSASTLKSLEGTRARYYDDYRFGDLFCSLKRAPESALEGIQSIDGVALCDSRIVTAARSLISEEGDTFQLQAVSIPDQGEPLVHRIHLRAGRWPEPYSESEAIVSEAFAAARGLRLGDRLQVAIEGKEWSFELVGIGLSPEFIYEIAPGGLLPNSKAFGVVWMRRRGLAAAAGMSGAFNDLVLRTAPGVRVPWVIREVDRQLGSYGGLGAYARSEQRSHRFLTSEMEELQGMAIVAPSLFLMVAALLMNLVLTRWIGSQREQIAMLKAFGFTSWEVALPYLALALMLALLGTLFGLLLGVYLGEGMTAMYSRFFHFPNHRFELSTVVLLRALVLTSLSALLAVGAAAMAVIRLQPAEAMRPEAPIPYGNGWQDRLVSWMRMPPATGMMVRHIARHPRRVLLSILGIASAVTVLVLGSFMRDAIDAMFDMMLGDAKRHDYQVTFTHAVDESVASELRAIDGVMDVELFRMVAARMTQGNRQRLLAIQGIEPDGRMQVLIDSKSHRHSLPGTGVLASRKLLESLGTDVSGTLHADVREEHQPVLSLKVGGAIDDVSGEGIWIDRRTLCTLLRESPRATGAWLRIDANKQADVVRQLRERPVIVHIESVAQQKASFRATIAENVGRMRWINRIFSLIIAMGVLASTGRLSILERQRDLATLRVLGYRTGELHWMMASELMLLTLLAIPLGWVLGYAGSYATVHAFDRELFRIPLVVSPGTYLQAAGIVLAATLVIAWSMRYRIARLDEVAVLKARQ